MFERNLLRLCVGLALCLAAGMVSAGSLIDQRGYVTCVDDVQRDYPRHAGLVHGRYYFHEQSRDSMTYYVNSTAWQDGDRVRLRTRCLTDSYGRDLMARETHPGRWVQQRGRVTVEEVANR
jgi:hypothetical protein